MEAAQIQVMLLIQIQKLMQLQKRIPLQKLIQMQATGTVQEILQWFPEKTVLSRYVEAVIVVGWVHLHTDRCPYVEGLYSSFRIPVHLIRSIIIKGTPLLVNETLWSSGMAMLVQCYSVRGLNVVAAMNISNTINNLFSVVCIALGNAVSIVVGQLLGAGRMEEARDTDNKLIAFSNNKIIKSVFFVEV